MAPTAVAQPPRPPKPGRQRYFKGKGPEVVDSDESDDDEDNVEQQQSVTKANDESRVAGGAGRLITNRDMRRGLGKDGGVKMSLGDVKIGGSVKQEQQGSDEDDEEESEEEDEDEEEVKPPRIPGAPGDESSEYETDSEEESEEEKKPAFRPVFVKKDRRGMTAAKLAEEAEEAARKEEELQAQRKLDSKELAGETIRRELAEKEAGTDLQPDVDDTDGIDPELEFDQWRARELARLLRDKQAQAARDAEQEEIERRRAMPEEQRLAEDMAYADETRAREQGQMGFMQKYYHKGAFHAGGEADALLNRDYTAATESAVDMSMLPKVMQVKNFGKASRTKYTHLTDQDTSGGGWGNAARAPMGGPGGPGGQTDTGCWNCGGPHQRKDCPNNDMAANDPMSIVPGYQAGARASGSGSGANSSALGSGAFGAGSGGGSGSRPNNDYRKEGMQRRFEEERTRPRSDARDRDRDRDEGYIGNRSRDEGYGRDRRSDRDDDRDRRRHDDYGRDRDRKTDRHRDRSRSRSRSPRRDRERDDRRRRDDRDRERDRR